MTSMLSKIREDVTKGIQSPGKILPSLQSRLLARIDFFQERRYSTRAEKALTGLDKQAVRRDRVASLVNVLDLNSGEIERYLTELDSKREFLALMNERHEHIRTAGIGTGTSDWIDCETVYLVTRALKPSVVVETGIQFGATSAYILLALDQNGAGQLHSIDLPWPGLAGVGEPLGIGYLAPEWLRHRWHVILGDSTEHLPKLLADLGRIDMFNHDSLHTYKFMTWEYRTVWPYLRPGGVLASHDIRRHNAFQDFCRRNGPAPYTLIYNQGVARKPE